MDKKMLEDELERVNLLLDEIDLLQDQIEEGLTADEPDLVVLEYLDIRVDILIQRVERILGTGVVRS